MLIFFRLKRKDVCKSLVQVFASVVKGLLRHIVFFCLCINILNFIFIVRSPTNSKEVDIWDQILLVALMFQPKRNVSQLEQLVEVGYVRIYGLKREGEVNCLRGIYANFEGIIKINAELQRKESRKQRTKTVLR